MTEDDDKSEKEPLVKLELRVRKDVEEAAKKALNVLGGDLYSLIGLPLLRHRVRQLTKLAKEVAALRKAMRVLDPKPLPLKVQRLVLEEASVEEDSKIQALWAQLVANQQAGMSVDAYLYELLTKITSTEAQQIARQAEYNRILSIYSKIYGGEHPRELSFEDWLGKEGLDAPEPMDKTEWVHPHKLVSLGVLEILYTTESRAEELSIHDSRGDYDGIDVDVEVFPDGYQLTELGDNLYAAACRPWSPHE